MSQFERDLRESLRRREPPADFAEKVLARTIEARPHRTSSWRWLGAAASIVLVIGATFFIQERQRQAEGEKAKEQLMVAFRITGAKVRDIQARVDSIQKRVVYPQLNP